MKNVKKGIVKRLEKDIWAKIDDGNKKK